VLEAPAAVVLHAAHRELANETLPPELLQLLRPLGAAYGSLLMRDLWHSPTREAIDAFVSRAAQQVTGTVRLRLVAGRCTVVEGPRTPVAVEP
jgi:argininosuccinate synthase